MEILYKSARLEKQETGERELALINAQALRELSAEEVFTFRLAACNDQVDRDGERFTAETLAELAELYVGRPVLRDHTWSAETQTARVFSAEVVESGGVKQLVLGCYMVRTASTADTIAAIEGGILRECSVGCAVKSVVCSICGANQGDTLCKHIQGHEYDGEVCVMELTGAADAYEVSLVAVPAQPAAGVVKSKRYGGAEEPPAPEGADKDEHWAEEAALELEKMRF